MSARTVRRVQGHKASTSAGFDCRMFGPFELKGQHELHIKIKKVRALVAYLLLEGPTARSKMAGLLWGEIDDESARRNLRRELHDVRKSELGKALKSEGETLRLEGNWTSDVAEFNQAFEATNFTQMVEVYRGVFLQNLDLSDAAEFSEWLEHRREDFARKYAEALSQLAEEATNQGEHRQALDVYAKLLLQDPFQERIYRQMMQLHALLGEREQALERYGVCCELLGRELGVEPLPETTELANQIRTGVSLTPKPEAPPVSLGRFTAPLVGRETALAELRNSPVVLTLVLGEAGVGKTRLVKEFCAGQNTLWLRFPEDSAQTPLYAIAEAIRERTQTTGLSLEAPWRKEVERLVPELRVKTSSEPPAFTRPEERLHFLEGLTQALLNLCGEGVLVLDDLHWADSTSLELLSHLLRRLQQQPSTRLIVTSRPQELSANPAAERWLSGLEREGQAQRIGLEPLPESDVHRLIQTMSGAAEGQLFSRRLFQATQGNPYFLLETLRYLFDTQELSLEAGVGWSTRYDETTESYGELPIPPNVKHTVLERVKRLGGASQRLLEAASLMGAGFGLGELVPATALSDWESLDAIEAAVAARLLQFSDSGYSFQHDLARRAISEGLSPERKRLIHTKLAQSLIAREGNPARIAHHLEQSAQNDQAVGWRVKAAQAAEKIYAHHEALGHYGRALENGAAPEVAVAIHQARYGLWVGMAEMERCEEDVLALESLALAHPTLQAEVLLTQARHHNTLRQYGPALDKATQVLSLPTLSPAQRAQALLELGRAHLRLGNLSQAQQVLQQSLDHAAAVPAKLLAEIYSNLRVVAIYHGAFEQARDCAEKGLAICQRSADRIGAMDALSGKARILSCVGQYQQAVELFEACLNEARALGQISAQLFALVLLARDYLHLGQWNQAERCIEEGLELATLARDPLFGGSLLISKTRLLRYRGQLGAALKTLSSAYPPQQYVRSRTTEIVIGIHQAWLGLDVGNVAAARENTEQVLALAQNRENPTHLTWLYALLACCDLAKGKAKSALARLEQAEAHRTLSEVDNRAEAGLVFAQTHLALKQPEQALAHLEDLVLYPSIEARVLALRLEVSPSPAQIQTAHRLLAQPETSPLEALHLYRALIKALESSGKPGDALELRQKAREQVLNIGQTLEGYPELKTSFLHKHRDLLK